jgi:hypothetical protein
MERAGRGDRERPQDGVVAITAMKRAGGKPKGHKDTSVARMWAGTVDPHDPQAELEFLRALNAHLPREAFDELSRIAPDKVSDWTAQLHIHCPRVLEALGLLPVWRRLGAMRLVGRFQRTYGRSSATLAIRIVVLQCPKSGSRNWVDCID